jgi:hypothetical protein
MDLALIVIMLLSGVVEYTTRRFSDALVPSQKATASTDAASFVDNAWTSYQRRRMYLAAGAPIAVLIAVTVAWTLRQMPNLRIQESLQSGTTMKVFIGAAIGYVIFMFALQNILLLLTLGRVELVVKAVGIALAVNLAVGFVASRAVHYWAAVWGLIVGAAVLEWLTARIVRKVLGRLDYHYYAGF